MCKQAEILKSIQELAKMNSDISVVWLYGSRASDHYQKHSDFDIAIAFENFSLSPMEKYLRPNELAIDWAIELKLPTDLVSIVDLNQVPIYLAYNIVEDGKIIYQTRSSRAYKEENRIGSQYEYQLIENRRECEKKNDRSMD